MLVFCSYTLRDGLLTVDSLKDIKKLLSEYAQIYIDILDNDSINKQERVIKELVNSNILLVLRTPMISESTWVTKEYNIAIECNIPIIEVDANNINNMSEVLINTFKNITINQK